ncbi:hypothetical protein MITS9509_03191 [Synechococcus sp. MIT S9509]|nr:hypothetical protein [Synechococcus sp. MIT S9504]KZR84120.1 hypothetical protein MITS9504_03097 [Synechococcus sp. MIT S9504]KZR88865.1 hypothetical protein MITS9509_03191 [Synechococcus sp. MIT S9509]
MIQWGLRAISQDWQVTFKEPLDMKVGLEMSADAQWDRLVPVDPR